MLSFVSKCLSSRGGQAIVRCSYSLLAPTEVWVANNLRYLRFSTGTVRVSGLTCCTFLVSGTGCTDSIECPLRPCARFSWLLQRISCGYNVSHFSPVRGLASAGLRGRFRIPMQSSWGPFFEHAAQNRGKPITPDSDAADDAMGQKGKDAGRHGAEAGSRKELARSGKRIGEKWCTGRMDGGYLFASLFIIALIV